MAGIFLNYRREDSFGYAGRVYDKLSQNFDRSQIFMDVDTLNPGAPYVDDIHNAINSCVAMITLIGPKWLSVTDKHDARRIDDPKDLVHQEIASALNRNILVIPLLLPGASMPTADELPNDLQKLALRNAVSLSEPNFHPEMEKVIMTIKNEIKGDFSKTLKFNQLAILKGIFSSALLVLILSFSIAVFFYITPPREPLTVAETSAVIGASATMVVVVKVLLKLVLRK